MSIIKTENLTKIYNSDTVKLKALDKVNIDIKKGEFVSIVGASGSGKSTLMNILGCLDILNDGKYLLSGKDVSKLKEKDFTAIRRKSIGFIFQKFNLINTLNSLENVELPLIYKKYSKLKRKEEAKRALETVGLKDRIYHKPTELSGGQQQRVAIARAIVTNPEIILADEPTGNLDSKSSTQILSLLKELNEKGKTVIIITHDEKIADKTERKIIVNDGKIK